MAENEVRVRDERPWYQRFWEEGAPARQLSIQRGEVPSALQYQQEEQQFGLPGLISQLGGIQTGFNTGFYNTADRFSRWLRGDTSNAPLLGDLMYDPATAEARFGPSTLNPNDIILRGSDIPEDEMRSIQDRYRGQKDYPSPEAAQADAAQREAIRQDRLSRGLDPNTLEPLEPSATTTVADILAEYGGEFDNTPYDMAGDYLAERRAAQMRAIQDMYNEYAAETQANVDRIGDIYTGAEAGIGETYEGATGNIEQAYGSAQQQAADQMARLGIEEAAPSVINPMALSQAETLSNLEANRASGLGATQQFGATAGGFASDMATVAQQQALEGQRSLTDQLADQLFEIEMQRLQAQQAYNPYERAMQALQLEQALTAPQAEAQRFEQEMALELAKEEIRARSQYDNDVMRDLTELMGQGYTYDEAIEIIANTRMYNPNQ